MIPNANSANALVVIPSRLAATRLPNKPLADINGTPMIVHVWRRAVEANIGPVVVACGDRAILEAVEAAGGRAVMTDPGHPSGSDRVWEAVSLVDPQGRHDIIVNVQGDMPTLDGVFIGRALDPFVDPAVDVTTLVCEIADPSERERPSVVKAVVAWGPAGIGRALYFSRATVPTGPGPLYHHLGLYAYRRAALERFVSLPPAPLELREKLEQLRALEAGLRIDVVEISTIPLNLDTPEDLERAREMLKG